MGLQDLCRSVCEQRSFSLQIPLYLTVTSQSHLFLPLTSFPGPVTTDFLPSSWHAFLTFLSLLSFLLCSPSLGLSQHCIVMFCLRKWRLSIAISICTVPHLIFQTLVSFSIAGQCCPFPTMLLSFCFILWKNRRKKVQVIAFGSADQKITTIIYTFKITCRCCLNLHERVFFKSALVYIYHTCFLAWLAVEKCD